MSFAEMQLARVNRILGVILSRFHTVHYKSRIILSENNPGPLR
jgi:hypothetical protein